MKMKFLKRAGSLFLALTVVMSMCICTAFAANAKDPSITVKNVETGAAVNAYQIVKEENGKWVPVNSSFEIQMVDKDGNVNTDTTKNVIPKPTPAQLQAIANTINTANAATPGTYEANPLTESTTAPGEYSASGLDSGLYLVTVDGGKDIYNPMMVGVDYKTDNASSTLELPSDTAYAKKAEPDIQKAITDGGTAGDNGKGNSAEVGDVLTFTVTTTIPSYGTQYKAAAFNIEDTLDAGLTLVEDTDSVKIQLGSGTAAKVENGADTDAYTFAKTANGYKFKFKSAYLLGDGNGQTVTITYKAKVNDSAKFNFDPNNNTATLNYTNDVNPTPEELENPSNTDSDVTHTYTFGIDANLTGEEITGNVKTHEIIKVDENGPVSPAQTFTDSTTENAYTNALKDAVFTLYTDEACETPALKADEETPITGKSDDNGYLEIKGLKEGTYYLKETTAPDGYTLSTQVVKVEISAEYNTDGTLKSYQIKMNNQVVSAYTFTIDNGTKKIVPTEGVETSTFFFSNVTLPELPSTGGKGIMIFLAIGMAIVMISVFGLRRQFRKTNA